MASDPPTFVDPTQMEDVQDIPLQRPIVHVFGVLVFAMLPIFLDVTGDPASRGFFCGDASIWYPESPQTISVLFLICVTGIAPCVVIVAVESLRYIYEIRNRMAEEVLRMRVGGCPISPWMGRVYYFVGFFIIGFMVTLCITVGGQYAAGRLRPNYIDVCKPDWSGSKINCSVVIPPTYVNVDALKCTGNAVKVKNAKRSFPAEHSAYGLYAAMFLAIHFHLRSLVDPVCVIALQIFVMAGGLAISVFSITDNRHHADDVVFGGLIGIVVSFWVTLCAGRFHSPPDLMVPKPKVRRLSSAGGAH